MKINQLIENVKKMSQEDKNRLLKDAIKINNITFIEFAIELGAGKCLVDYELFFLAVQNGYAKVVKLQIKAGADVTIEENRAILLASQRGHVEVVNVLIKAGANVNAKNKYNDNSICLACNMGYEKVVKSLIEAGGDVTIENNRAIYRAAYHGHANVVRLLIEAGADATSDSASAALDMAILSNYTETVEILINAGANSKNYYENLWRARNNNNEIIENLLIEAAKKSN